MWYARENVQSLNDNSSHSFWICIFFSTFFIPIKYHSIIKMMVKFASKYLDYPLINSNFIDWYCILFPIWSSAEQWSVEPPRELSQTSSYILYANVNLILVNYKCKRQNYPMHQNPQTIIDERNFKSVFQWTQLHLFHNHSRFGRCSYQKRSTYNCISIHAFCTSTAVQDNK